MQTSQRLSNYQRNTTNSPQQRSEAHEKSQQKTGCLLKTIKLFLQTIIHFLKLYRYNNRWDFLLMFVGIFFSIATGFGLPLFAVLAGQTIDAFDQTAQILADEASQNKNLLLIIGFSMFATGWVAFSAWIHLGQRVSMRFRQQYLKSLIKQQVNFFQDLQAQQLSSKFEQHINNIKEAAGLKAGALIYIAASFIIAGKIASQSGFFMSLIMVPTLPILGISGFAYSILVQLKQTRLMQFYSNAQEKAKQALNFIKTVKQLNGQSYQVSAYQKYLFLVKQKVIRYSLLAGLGAGVFSLMQYLVYALAFWLGSHCVEGTANCGNLDEDKYTPGDVILIFFAFFVRLDSMQQLFPSLKRVYNGTTSYEQIFRIIRRKPAVCCPSEKQEEVQIDLRTMKLGQLGEHLKKQAIKLRDRFYDLTQNVDLNQINEQLAESIKFERLIIEYRNVTLFNPRDKSKKILDNVSFKIDRQLTALSGRSEEKQAVLDLILRIYDPDDGQILINGVNIKKINLCYLRKKIGYLDRKTYIFDTTIRQNITMGNQQITDDVIWNVLETLEIAETIKLFEEQLNSQVGFEGGKLSDREKKKISLARVMVKNPQILLFKECFSYITEDQEYKFYCNLEKFKKHRVLIYSGTNDKILKKADQIIVISMGKVEAVGNFYNLPQYFHEQIALEQDIQMSHKGAEHILKSSLKSSHALKSSEIGLLNQSESFSQFHQFSPQKMLYEYEEAHLAKYKKEIHSRLFNYLRGNFFLYFTGFVICFISGALYPIFTIFMADILLQTFDFQDSTLETSYIRQKINSPIFFIVWIGLISFVINWLQVFIFSYIAEKMGEQMRVQTYTKVLKLPIKWFKETPLQSAYKTNQAIKNDPAIVQNLLTNFYSIIIKNTSSFIIGILIAFIFEWRSALLGFIVLPMMMLSGYLSVIFYRGELHPSEKDYLDSTSLLTEAVINIRAVHTQTCHQMILKNYKSKLEKPFQKAKKRAYLSSAVFGLSQLLIFVSYTIMFFFGTAFYRDNGDITTLNLLTAIFAVIWSGWTSGANFIRLPNKSECEKSAANIFFILEEVDEEEIQIKEKSKLLKEGIQGQIQFKEVKISFPQRGFSLDKVSFKIRPNTQIAIFGIPGIGIKPIIDLLYRFTEIEEGGKIFIDNQNIKDYQINYLRSVLGVVSDDPVVFEGTLYENIVYNKEEVQQRDILNACKITNAIQIVEGRETIQQTQRMSDLFINSQRLPIQWKGLQTYFNVEVEKISTSQKQRIAMARTMLRNPQILFINDEIPSVSYIYEESIRGAIKKIMKDRTTLFMPHYEQTLKSSHKIIMLEREKILQFNRYQELAGNKNMYKKVRRNYDLI